MSLRRARPLLGTLFEVRIDEGDARAFEAAFAAADTVHCTMSAHDSTSDVGRLNQARAGDMVRVHAWTFSVLEKALEIWRRTSGLFDPCIAPLVQRAGFLPGRGTVPGGTCSDIELVAPGAVLLRRPVAITLDGIAKGFAVDRAVQALRDAGVLSGAVNGGGDLRVFGPQAEPVHVRDPASPTRLVCIGYLREAAIATSGAYFTRTPNGESHLFHPATGRSYAGDSSVSVIAHDCISADALAKAALLDPAGAAPALEHYRARAIVLEGRKAA